MFVAAMAIESAGFMACSNGTPKANLKSDVDSLVYAIGMAQSPDLKGYMEQGLGVDTAYIAEFIKGMNEGVNAGDNKKKAAYYAGLQIGQQISNRMVPGLNQQIFGEDSTKSFSLKNFMAGLIGGLTGKKGIMTVDSAQMFAQVKMQQVKARELEKTYGPNKVAGEKFLAENKTKEGVKELANGVQYKVLVEGNGAIPSDTSLVKVNYEGKTIDGNVFDTTEKRGEPATFRANQVIKGWTEALCHMPAGSVWEVYIPQDQAYGERMQGDIKPFSALIFKIELLEVNPKRK